jgi:DNA phosphorothioation-dependent restriction protein DptF
MLTNDLTLYELLRNCQLGEAGLIVGGSEESDQMREGLYIETELDKIVKSFFINDVKLDGKMLVILGSAGDGKSALLVNWNKRARAAGVQPLPNIHLDATASFKPHEQYDITLNEFFKQASLNVKNQSGNRSALAINLGLAINFFETRDYKKNYPEIWEVINEVRIKNSFERDNIVVINLSRREMFDARPEHLGEGFLLDIINKFDFSDPKSPFHNAYEKEKMDCGDEGKCILFYNAIKFIDPNIRKMVAKVFAARSLINGTHLNPRLIIHMVSSILLNPQLRHFFVEDDRCPLCDARDHDKIEFEPGQLLWSAIFEQNEYSDLTLTGLVDPVAQANLSLDFFILNLSSSPKRMDDEMKSIKKLVKTSKKERQEFIISTFLRSRYLYGDKDFNTIIESTSFKNFLGLYSYLKNDKEEYRESAGNVNGTLKKALRCWAGSVDESHLVRFVDGYKTPEFEFMSEWKEPKFSISKSSKKTKESIRTGMVWMVLDLQHQGDRNVAIPLTFDIYQLMLNVIQGYNPSSVDLNRSEGIQLIASRLSDFTSKNSFVQVVERDGDRTVIIKVDELDTVRIEQVK